MLTDLQRINLHKLDLDVSIEILHECAERLGAVNVTKYSEVMCIPKRTVYQLIKNNKIKYVTFCGNKYPIINS